MIALFIQPAVSIFSKLTEDSAFSKQIIQRRIKVSIPIFFLP
jgi:hypothetical protein